jgi:hypothetical protein
MTSGPSPPASSPSRASSAAPCPAFTTSPSRRSSVVHAALPIARATAISPLPVSRGRLASPSFLLIGTAWAGLARTSFGLHSSLPYNNTFPQASCRLLVSDHFSALSWLHPLSTGSPCVSSSTMVSLSRAPSWPSIPP